MKIYEIKTIQQLKYNSKDPRAFLATLFVLAIFI